MDQHQSSHLDPQFRDQLEGAESVEAYQAGGDLNSKLIHFWQSCLLRRRLILGMIASGMAASVVLALLVPNMYTSTATLMPPESVSPFSSLLSLLSSTGGSTAAGLGGAALGLRTQGALFTGILASRTVQESLVNRFDLRRYYRTAYTEVACKRLGTNSTIDEDRKTGIITISVRAKNAVLAANLAQAYVQELDRVVTNNSTSAAHRERVFLEGRLNDIKQDLNASSQALSRFSTNTGAIDISSQTKAAVDSGLKLEEDLVGATSDLAALRQTYSEDNVRVRAAKARRSELQRQLDRMMGLTQDPGAKSDAARADFPAADQLPALGLTYYDLERKVRVEEAIWEALTKQYESAKVEEVEETPSVRVLDAPQVPQRKSSPTRWIIVVFGTMLSSVMACMLVFTLSSWEELDPHDQRKMLIAELVTAWQQSGPRHWRLPESKLSQPREESEQPQ